jgi:hypothetical protein
MLEILCKERCSPLGRVAILEAHAMIIQMLKSTPTINISVIITMGLES